MTRTNNNCGCSSRNYVQNRGEKCSRNGQTSRKHSTMHYSASENEEKVCLPLPENKCKTICYLSFRRTEEGNSQPTRNLDHLKIKNYLQVVLQLGWAFFLQNSLAKRTQYTRTGFPMVVLSDKLLTWFQEKQCQNTMKHVILEGFKIKTHEDFLNAN